MLWLSDIFMFTLCDNQKLLSLRLFHSLLLFLPLCEFLQLKVHCIFSFYLPHTNEAIVIVIDNINT